MSEQDELDEVLTMYSTPRDKVTKPRDSGYMTFPSTYDPSRGPGAIPKLYPRPLPDLEEDKIELPDDDETYQTALEIIRRRSLREEQNKSQGSAFGDNITTRKKQETFVRTGSRIIK